MMLDCRWTGRGLALVVSFSWLVGFVATSDAQTAQQQAEVQNFMKLVPKLGPSVASITSGQQKVGGFVAGSGNWIVTLGHLVDQDAPMTVSFKKGGPFDVSGVRFHDKKSDIIVLEWSGDAGRDPIPVSRSPAKTEELHLFFGVPNPGSVGMSLGVRDKFQTRGQIKDLADWPIDAKVSMTIFQVGASHQGTGTPVIGGNGEALGLIVDSVGNNIYAIGSKELERVLEIAVDPAAAEQDAPKNVPAGEAAIKKPNSEIRLWTSSNGKFKTKARLVAQRDGKVQLELSDGKKIVVRVDSLSAADREFLEKETRGARE